jgi:hypothetical protein
MTVCISVMESGWIYWRSFQSSCCLNWQSIQVMPCSLTAHPNDTRVLIWFFQYGVHFSGNNKKFTSEKFFILFYFFIHLFFFNYYFRLTAPSSTGLCITKNCTAPDPALLGSARRCERNTWVTQQTVKPNGSLA